MANLIVQSYRVRWNTREHTGSITLTVLGQVASNPFLETFQTIEVEDPEEMRLLIDILRHEKPLRFKTENRELFTEDREPVGEAE